MALRYEESLSVVGTVDDDITFVTVSGAIDVATVHKLRSTLDSVFTSETRALVLDLSDVSFLASAGIQCLMEAQKRFGPSLIIVASTRIVVRPLILTRLNEVLTIVPSATHARDAIRPALD